ncbi:MAG TPA: 2'-5' RNA ligase family protein [Candidatus Tumulicola sp.]
MLYKAYRVHGKILKEMQCQTGIIVPVPMAESTVAAIRGEYDPAAKLGVPAHITLLFPWLPLEEAIKELPNLCKMLGDFEAFHFSLSDIGTFDRCVYLRPDPMEPFVEMTAHIAQRWPTHPPYGNAFSDIIPHLTLGDELERELVDRLAATEISLPLQAIASEAWLITSDESGYWRKSASISFRTHTQHQSTTRWITKDGF